MALAFVLAAAAPAVAQNNPFNPDGFPAARGTYGSFPYEQVDPLSGNLIISVTDLSLPGPIPLTVSRSYNSKFHADFEHGSFAIDEWSPVGVGWRMHFGRVLRADDATSGKTVIEGGDGGGGALYQTSAYPEGWISKGFARYNRMNHTAKLPNGLTYTFGHIGEAGGPRGQVRYTTEIRDQFNNTISIAYGAPGRVSTITQVLNANQSRVVSFAYNGDGTLATITYSGRIWRFYYDPAPGAAGHQVLRRVEPPAGLSWEHQYANNGSGPYPCLSAGCTPRSVTYQYDVENRLLNVYNRASSSRRTLPMTPPAGWRRTRPAR
ncbi:MAG TPA: DUF6531 domain-containing protein [Jiangellaceae bacterium]|nr:DUF6531 domain-containing protein [Jiangellaceae bacterium]